MKFQNLPAEIVYCIIEYIQNTSDTVRSDLFNITRVCGRWRRVINPFEYKKPSKLTIRIEPCTKHEVRMGEMLYYPVEYEKGDALCDHNSVVSLRSGMLSGEFESITHLVIEYSLDSNLADIFVLNKNILTFRDKNKLYLNNDNAKNYRLLFNNGLNTYRFAQLEKVFFKTTRKCNKRHADHKDFDEFIQHIERRLSRKVYRI